VRTLVLPRRNEKNLIEDVPREVRQVMTIHLVESVGEVVGLALEEPAARVPALS
jgi:ATP-dependent Lon protease